MPRGCSFTVKLRAARSKNSRSSPFTKKVETSWEPAEVIKEDVPVLFARFVDEKPDDPDRLHMTEALDALAGRLLTVATALPVPKKRRRKRATPEV
ncbi:hypothetical protein PF011_g4500 [Phytophthora fragariae]|uniref:Chromo domain-containing protein n=1 Tax=Phytophthora fragariae TaxID=53985 RepID=A0A6A3LWB3_9STRA|nr:hypothetical protein PF011_g4500 [Phytophthora fragariae]